jgi:hypothetical protein
MKILGNNVMKHIIVIVILALITCCFLQTTAGKNSGDTIRIGIIYNGNSTGNRYYEGILSVLDSAIISDYNLEIKARPYIHSFEGEKILEEFINSDSADVILGPTESEVFSRVHERMAMNKNMISVISGTVTTDVGNSDKGYFFRLNLDAHQRVEEMWNYLNKYWFSTVAVIYENTEFGRNAEKAFKELIPEKIDKGLYYPIPFNTNPPEKWREMIDKILEERPELVGMFCERDYVKEIYNDIKLINHSGVSYNPVFFSIIDIVKSAENIDNFYFPSLKYYDNRTKVSNVPNDEVFELGVITAKLLLTALSDFKENLQLSITNREYFRDQLVKILKFNEPIEDNKSSSGFFGMKNQQSPYIYSIKNNEIFHVSIDENINWWEQFLHKINLVFSTYGNYIILNIFLIFIISLIISQSDIRRSFPRKHIKIYKSYVFYLFVLFHLFLVLALYIFLTEFRHIKHTDTLMVILISLTPSAFLKTTVFETSQGKSMGLERLYKQFTDYIDDKIMNSRYRNIEALVNTIAYNNSENTMKRALTRVYKNNRSKERASRLIHEMEKSFSNESDYLDRRRAAARLLMRQFDYQQLMAEGFVPFDWDYENPINPQVLLRFMAKHCSETKGLPEKVDQEYKQEMANLRKRNEEQSNEIISAHEKEMSIIMVEKALILVKLRLIVVMNGFNKDKLLKLGFLTKEILERCIGHKKIKERRVKVDPIVKT